MKPLSLWMQWPRWPVGLAPLSPERPVVEKRRALVNGDHTKPPLRAVFAPPKGAAGEGASSEAA